MPIFRALSELVTKTGELIEHLQKTGRLAPCFVGQHAGGHLVVAAQVLLLRGICGAERRCKF
jgi:hypothetical protein